MENKNNKEIKEISGAIIACGFLLMLGLVVAGFFVRSGISSLSQTASVSVKGYAERDIISDLAIWNGRVSVSSPTLKEGFMLIKQQTDKVVEYLIKNNFKPEEIQLSTITQYEDIEYFPAGGNRKIGYKFTQQVSIQGADIDKIIFIADKSTELILEGIDFESQQIQYLYTKLDDLKIDMLAEATNDAKARAEQIAKTGGNKIKNIKSAQQGVFQITPRYSTDIYDYGMNDTYSKEKTIKSVVTITYNLE